MKEKLAVVREFLAVEREGFELIDALVRSVRHEEIKRHLEEIRRDEQKHVRLLEEYLAAQER